MTKSVSFSILFPFLYYRENIIKVSKEPLLCPSFFSLHLSSLEDPGDKRKEKGETLAREFQQSQ